MRFSRAIIVNPPSPPGYMSNKDSMGGFGQLYPAGSPPFPPLDIPYLAASLSARGHGVDVVEAGALRLDTSTTLARVAALAGTSNALVLVRTSLPTIDWDLGVCAQVRAALPATTVALFGPAVPSLLARVRQDASIHLALLTEADGPACDLMDGKPPAEIPGLLYRDAGEWRTTPDRPFERQLDSLPFPRWDLMPTDRYVIPKSSTAGASRFLPMLSSRGCPFGCSYCPYPVGQGLKWRYRSPANVVDEMEHLVRAHGVEYVLFRDPMFSAQQKRVVAICDEIVRRGLKVRWKCETRVDCLDEETIAAMARAGCAGVNFGVESIDPEIQKGVHRTPILEQDFLNVIESCRRHGIATFAFFVIGLPGDTRRTILESIAFAVRIRANWTQFTVATPFIGTPMYQWAVDHRFVEPEAYRIINAHEHSIGNEHLEPADIKRMHRFAQFLQNHLLNRHGILKDATRREWWYRTARTLADAASDAFARVLVRAGTWYYMRTIREHARAVHKSLAGSRPVATSAR